MTKLHKYFCSLLLLLLSPGLASATMNLNQLQQAALQHRQILQADKHQIQVQQYRVQEQQGLFLPRLDLVYQGQESSQDENLYQPSPIHQAGAQVNWNLYNGGRDHAEKSARKDEMHTAELGLHATTQAVQLNVALAFIDLWQARQSLATTEKALQQHEREATDARLRYNAGVLRKDELLSLEVAACQALYERNAARTQMQQARNSLERETGLDLRDEELDFSPLHAPIALPTTEQAYTQLKKHSSLQQLDTSRSAAENRARAAWGEHLPSADLNLSWTEEEDSWLPGRGDEDDEGLSLMLELNWNLYQGGRIAARQNQAQQEAATHQANRHEQLASLELQLQNLLLDREVAEENLAVARKNLQQAAESLRINRLSYQEGVSTVAELLQALTAQTRAEYQQTLALCDLRRAEYRIFGLLELFSN